jgi:hypothetical protein
MVTDQDEVGEKAAEGGASLLDAWSVHASPSFLTKLLLRRIPATSSKKKSSNSSSLPKNMK